ncbi:MAG: NIPSNAP family protein [Betaproteobacteria bacterium]|nr:NIPSNAP family protein [Betaproteobacteria bacterium]MDE2212850.1 NIPSNAP family protein [Betaproteobacteria bacterium]
MIYELRIYHCAPGRLPALNARFEQVTLKFWEKYGIRQAGFWTTLIGPSNQALTYLLQWESLAEREAKWNAFQADPEWIAKRAQSEADGIIVERIENHILAPTAYSALR